MNRNRKCSKIAVIFLSILYYSQFVSPTLITRDDETVIAKGPLGSWHGQVFKSRDGRNYFAFRGIRYGAVTGRFEAPVPVLHENRTVDAFEFGIECPQIRLFDDKVISDTEDCLFINVYVPEVKTEKLPVLFYVHGGAFIEGSGSYNGADYFMDEDVILVTVNYRLGVFGFLDTGDGEIDTNNGVRDIILSLEWVQQNIQAFQGDPDRVTIFGNSAGGDLVHLLMLSPAVQRGLIHGVIAMSGNALCSWSVVPTSAERARQLGRKVGCPVESTHALVACLNKTKMDVILRAQKEMWNPAPDWVDVPFGPTVDPHNGHPVLPDTPLHLLTGTWQNNRNVPLVVGLTEDEGIAILAGAYLSNATLMKELRGSWHERTSRQFGYLHYVPKRLQEEFSVTLKNLYFADGDIQDEKLTQLHTDFFFYRGARLTVDFHSFQGFRVYPYIFSYRGDFSFSSDWSLAPKGATHTDDIQYLFPSIVQPKPKWPYIGLDSQHASFSKNLVSLWVSFASNGVPSESWGDEWNSSEPPARIGEGDPQWLWLDKTTKSAQETEATRYRLAMLDSIFAEYEKPRVSWRGRPELRDEL